MIFYSLEYLPEEQDLHALGVGFVMRDEDEQLVAGGAADQGEHPFVRLLVQRAEGLDHADLLRRQGIVVGVLGIAADQIVERAVQRLCDGHDVDQLGRIADAGKDLAQRAQRNARHVGELIVGDLFFAFELLDSFNIRDGL